MRTVSFFSRFAFICNVLFVFCMVMRYTTDFIGSNAINGIIITLGIPVAPLANLLVCILYLTRLVSKKPLGVQGWLAMTNFLFLIIQIFVQFILV